MSAIQVAVKAVGGPIEAAKICGIKRQAVDKWLVRGALPRTEYTGETRYAELLAAAADGRFTAGWLLTESRPRAA